MADLPGFQKPGRSLIHGTSSETDRRFFLRHEFHEKNSRQFAPFVAKSLISDKIMLNSFAMTPQSITYAQLEHNIGDWARTRSDIQAAIVVGSRARADHPADEWSDLDLILFVGDPTVYVSDMAWLAAFGEVWLSVLDRTGRGDPEWLVVYAGGLKADFVLATAGPEMALPKMLAASPYQGVLRRGVRVLFDRNPTGAAPGNAWGCVVYAAPSAAFPTADEFAAAVQRFLLDATRAARLIRRGELWQAKQQCDCALKQHLLAMLEWHARAVHGPAHDVWYDGRYLAEWADPHALAALPRAFAGFDAESLWQALFETLSLYRRLGNEVARRLGYAYPAAADERITTWLGAFRP